MLPVVDQSGRVEGKKVIQRLFLLKQRETEFLIFGQMQCFRCVKIIDCDACEANCVNIFKSVLVSPCKGK